MLALESWSQTNQKNPKKIAKTDKQLDGEEEQ